MDPCFIHAWPKGRPMNVSPKKPLFFHSILCFCISRNTYPSLPLLVSGMYLYWVGQAPASNHRSDHVCELSELRTTAVVFLSWALNEIIQRVPPSRSLPLNGQNAWIIVTLAVSALVAFPGSGIIECWIFSYRRCSKPFLLKTRWCFRIRHWWIYHMFFAVFFLQHYKFILAHRLHQTGP